ncbi:MAG: hypothetical protein RIS94_2728 [Pseudomonadota bacterium]
MVFAGGAGKRKRRGCHAVQRSCLDSIGTCPETGSVQRKAVDMQRVVIVGAGAMGCLFAARLALAGVEAVLVDVDAARLERIAGEGVVLHDDSGEHRVPVRAARAESVSGPVDLLMLFTKGMHSAGAIRSVAHLVDTGCTVLTLQNGLGNAEAIADVFPAGSVLWGVTDFPADLQGANHVASHGVGQVKLGGFAGASAERAQAAADILNRGGLNAVVDPEVKVAVWEKVAFNATMNALCTVSGLPVGGLDTVAGRSAIATVIGEIAGVAAALGVSIDRARLEARIAFVLVDHRTHKPSMLQDRLAGRRSEIESINGAVLRAAAGAGLVMPALQVLTDLVRMGEPG